MKNGRQGSTLRFNENDLVRERYDHLIGGQWTAPANGRYFDGINPSTGVKLGTFARGCDEDVDRAVRSAEIGFKKWFERDAHRRGQILYRAAQLMRDHKDRLSYLESLDTGKPLSVSARDVEICARYFEYYAGAADKLFGEVIPAPGKHLVYTLREPYGVVGHIIPWNGPISQAGRGVAPSLAAGNAVVVKPAEQTCITALEIALLCIEAGLPPDAFNVVTGTGEEAGRALVNHHGVRKLSFTGSVEVGKLVMKGAADRIVPVSLELGGKSPFVVFEDADVEGAAQQAGRTVVANTGQICSAGTRHIVQRSVAKRFTDRLVEYMGKVTLGPALDDPQVGPLVNEEQLRRVLNYVEIGKREGARCILGGTRPQDPKLKNGYFVLPTVFVDVQNHMTIAREEIFGPVASVIVFDTEDEAVSIANDTDYGLAGAVWSKDASRAHRVAGKIQAGQIYINCYQAVQVEAPFGGYKQSGVGREKGIEALHHYTQLKTVMLPTVG
ncbi:MAG: aldehyde dehydrogenase [candidate division NC10 bacterium]|nr:aldehyde dehydrogenase [candidate division NC10 bacterium]